MSPEIELLTSLSTQPFSACEDQWKQLLRRLFLPMAYIPAIQAVLEKGRWKRQPDPMAYLRKGSLRCALRLGIVDVRRNLRRETLATDLNFKDADGKPLGHDDRLGTALHRHDEQFCSGRGASSNATFTRPTVPNGWKDAFPGPSTIRNNGRSTKTKAIFKANSSSSPSRHPELRQRNSRFLQRLSRSEGPCASSKSLRYW
jgi:hypothetical protein